MYFVMIGSRAGVPVPVVDDDGVMLFDYEEDAVDYGDQLDAAFGFEVYEWDQ